MNVDKKQASAAEKLSALLRFPTVAGTADYQEDRAAFEGCRAAIHALYPGVAAHCERHLIAGRGLVYHWRGKAQGKPWVWRARFFGHQPQADLALLARGFHLAYMDVVEMFGNPQAVAHWNAFYRERTTRNGLARRVALEGMSRGGLYIYNWAAANPEKVACIYADAPVCDIHSWAKRKGKSPTAARFFADWLRSYGLTEERP